MRRLYLSPDARRRAKNLLTQQCWCWGQDVRGACGNALLQFGFERVRPPESQSGASMYCLNNENCEVVLWGFGMYYRSSTQSKNGVFLPRFSFEPKLCAPPAAPLWLPSQIETRLPCTTEERRQTREQTARALLWVESYEDWALQTFGDEYRCVCLQAWSQPFVPPREALAAWPELARACLRGRA